MSKKKLLINLKKYMGFNISELNKIFSIAQDSKYPARLHLLYSFCEWWKSQNIGPIGIYAYTEKRGGKSLMNCLTAEVINEKLVRDILGSICVKIIDTKIERLQMQKVLVVHKFQRISPEEQRERLLGISRTIN
jgi:hypothetical protein